MVSKIIGVEHDKNKNNTIILPECTRISNRAMAMQREETISNMMLGRRDRTIKEGVRDNYKDTHQSPPHLPDGSTLHQK